MEENSFSLDVFYAILRPLVSLDYKLRKVVLLILMEEKDKPLILKMSKDSVSV